MEVLEGAIDFWEGSIDVLGRLDRVLEGSIDVLGRLDRVLEGAIAVLGGAIVVLGMLDYAALIQPTLIGRRSYFQVYKSL